MRVFRWTMLLVLIVILVVAVQQSLLFYGMVGVVGESQVKSLDDGDQEIALIEPATNLDDWGRLVTAVRLLEADWQRINPTAAPLSVSIDGAFPKLTSDVPEIALSFAAEGPRLFVRWYKITGEHDPAAWLAKLKKRSPPPLAIIGGGTSDRAVRLAQALQDAYRDPTQPSPTLLITTATAEKTEDDKQVIGVYEGRSFRFSFTNEKMVAALLEFVQQTPNLWPYKPVDPQEVEQAAAGAVGAEFQSFTLHTVRWMDERYSKDMASHFEKEFTSMFPLGRYSHQGDIKSGVGDFFQPAPQEQVMVDTLLSNESPIAPHSLLVVPTQTVRMRRFLINLHLRSPQDARNLVILNGDGISFHSVYRDRDVMWNILDLPYSLLFFSHRDPIDQAAGFDWTKKDRAAAQPTFPQRTTSGTHDVLLFRDLIESVVYAAFDRGELLNDAQTVRDRLRATCWYLPPLNKAKDDRARVCHPLTHSGANRAFFDADGNRQSHTGEHIIWVLPMFTGDRVDLTSNISVWTNRPAIGVGAGVWHAVSSQPVRYNQSRQQERAP